MRTRDFDQIFDAVLGKRFGVADDFVHALQVESGIDGARALTIQLLRQTTRAENHDLLIVTEEATARPMAWPKGIATRWFRHWVALTVDRYRNDGLIDGYENPIDVSKADVSMNGIELQDRKFIKCHSERARTKRHHLKLKAPDS